MDATTPQAAAYRFDRFTLDLARGALLGDGGAELPLRPKPFALLRLLVENAGRLLGRDTIMAAVWPDVVVSDESITQCVRDIRKALNDEGQRLLKTVPKRGYLFAAEVTPIAPAAATPRAERRLAAILAADIVGYSRLVEQDEAATLAALKVLRQEVIDPLLAEHKGRIVKLMGDGALAEFGSVVDAVACAVAVQRGVAEQQAGVPAERRVVFRIGVNLGDVVVEGEDILGDGVNIAARLEQLCEPGGVLISGTAYDHLQGRLGLPLEDAGEQQVKNIARPVRTYRVRLDGVPARRPVSRLARRAVAAALALLLLAAAVAGGWWWRQVGEPGGPPLPAEPSVAVLPFDNATGDERLGRLADGMVENVIADLPRHGLFVIARGTSFSYRDKPPELRDPRAVGRELGVRYVVDGSLEGDGRRLRATVNLVDAVTGKQLWSERYDRPVDDLFAVQDELAQRIFNAVGGAFGATLRAATEAARRKPTENLQAYDLLLLAREERLRHTEEGNTKAIELAKRAIELDPSSWLAHYSLAEAYSDRYWPGWSAFDEVAADWLAEATRAAELDPSSGWPKLVLAYYYGVANDGARYKDELERAASLADGDALLMAMVAAELPWTGQSTRAVDMLEHALRLDPGSTDRHRWIQVTVYFYARRFEAAAAAIDDTAWETLSISDLARYVMIYAQLGRPIELERWRSRLLTKAPDFSTERLLDFTGEYMPAAAAERALVLEGVAKAGLPMCATPEQLAAKPEMRRMPECEAERAKAAASRT